MGVMYDKILGKLREGEGTSQYAQIGNTPQILPVSAIETLTSAQVGSLRAGDVVVVNQDKGETGDVYTVVFKTRMFVQLVRVLNGTIDEVLYFRTTNTTTWNLFQTRHHTPTIRITTSDITSLTHNQLSSLQPGDVVQKNTGTQAHTYLVAYKDDTVGECSLVYADAWNVEEVYYEIRNGAWTYVQTDNTAISVDPIPTSASPNPVSSGGVYTALEGKADKTVTVDLSEQTTSRFRLYPGRFYKLGNLGRFASTNITLIRGESATGDETPVWQFAFVVEDGVPRITWIGIDMWEGGKIDVEEDKYYQVRVMDGLAVHHNASIITL